MSGESAKTDKKVIIRKILTFAAVASFPVGVLILGAPDSWFAAFRIIPKEQRQALSTVVQDTMAQEVTGIKQLDVDILRARGEVLKLKEMRDEKLGQLQTLQAEITKMIDELSKSDFGEVSTSTGVNTPSNKTH